MINTLVIAPTFLRSSCAVGQILRHFISGLNNNHHAHILCSSNNDLELSSNNISIHQFAENKLPHYVDRVSHRIHLTDLSFSPDPFYYSWNKKAYREAKIILKQEQIDYILTINNPVSSHLLGLRLKRQFNLPWVAYLFDPWHNNPFRKYQFEFLNRRDEMRERDVAENADMLLFPNNELMESWIEIYGNIVKEKSFVLPFATRIPEITDINLRDKRTVISHIGNLSDTRRAKTFLDALRLLRKNDPTLLNKILFNVVGYMSVLDKDIIIRENLNDIVNIVGHVSEEECIKYYESSDLFLIVDIDCTPNLFYPSKLLKYFCYKKPIIGITTENSVVANELMRTGNHVFKYHDSNSICDFLQQVIIDPSFAKTNDTNYYKKFLAENVAEKYLDLLNKIL